MRSILAVLGTATFFINHLAQAGALFQDNFNSATTFTNKWTVSTTHNGGTATVQNGKLVLETAGGSNGYMGIGDGVSISPRLSSLNLTHKTITFNLHELLRHQTNGNKDNVGFYFGLSKGENRFHVSLHGNYSGYTPDDPSCGWACYNTYNKHTLWIAEFTPAGENRFLKIDLNNSLYYNYFFRITVSANKIVVGYRPADQANYTDQVAKVSGYNLPTAVNLGVSTGDGGYTYENAAGKFEVDAFAISDTVNTGVTGVADNLIVGTTTCVNNTTNQSVTATTSTANKKWQCKGLSTQSGDSVSVTLEGEVP